MTEQHEPEEKSTDNNIDWEVLRGRIENGKCTPFIGAGADRKSIKNLYSDFKKLYIDFLVPQNQYENEYKKWGEFHQSLFGKPR